MTIADASTELDDLTGLAPLHPILPHVIIYSLPVCPNCDRLKQQFKRRGLTPVSIDISQTPDAYEEFNGRLGVLSTPIVLVHNVFERPVFFSGKGAVPVDQGAIVARALTERLAHLVAGGYLDGDAQSSYLERLEAMAAENHPRYPSVDARAFVELAGKIAPAEHSLFPRVRLAPGNELTSSKSEAPAVLMTN